MVNIGITQKNHLWAQLFNQPINQGRWKLLEGTVAEVLDSDTFCKKRRYLGT